MLGVLGRLSFDRWSCQSVLDGGQHWSLRLQHLASIEEDESASRVLGDIEGVNVPNQVFPDALRGGADKMMAFAYNR